MEERKMASIFKMSVSDLVVSSTPGVSTSVSMLPSSSKVFATSMLDLRPFLTARWELLSRLMNYGIIGEHGSLSSYATYCRFSRSCGTHHTVGLC